MTINEIANDILKKEDNQLARAFTMVIGSLLISKGIQPIINKSKRYFDENDDLNKYIIRTEYNVTFDIDTSEHDKQVRDEVKTCDGCKHNGKWENEIEYGYNSPCTLCRRRCLDNYEADERGTE